MKKLFIFALAAIGLLACAEKNAPDEGAGNGGSTNPKEISCEPSVIEFEVSQDVTSTITLTANGAWSATTNVDWITIDPLSGQGSSFVKVLAKAGKQAEGKILFSTEKATAQVIVKRIDKYPGSFSVATDKRVYFSSGNLQYKASSKTWRFAEHQYDMIGYDNENVSSYYDGWIDLFGWGASGYNSVYPWIYAFQDQNNYTNYEYYCYKGDSDIAGTNYDWGVYNAISNGGNETGLWRTLTYDEWKYLLNGRGNANALKRKTKISNISGLLLFPDGWNTPNGINANDDNYDLTEWQLLESCGAIFLPNAGVAFTAYSLNEHGVYPVEVRNAGQDGEYWSSTGSTNNKAQCIHIGPVEWLPYRNFARSVRLVRDVK